MNEIDVHAAEAILAGRGGARPATDRDAINGVLPRLVVEPDAAEALAEVLGWCSRAGLRVVLQGSGTKLGWSNRSGGIDLALSTRRMNRLVAHRYGDLTATVEAGIRVATLNRELAQHGQWLPIDAAFEEATIGGTIAANDSGPLRHRHGSARDLLLGVQLATADGCLVKSGGHVVKNVAGYDLGKLMSGSGGTLAAITTATFKLAPLPQASATLGVSFGGSDALAVAVRAIAESQLEPVAFEIHVFAPPASGSDRTPACQLLVRFSGMPEAIEGAISEAEFRLQADRALRFTGSAEDDVWREHRDLIWAPPGAVIKLSWLPASLPILLAAFGRISESGASVALAGRAGLGAGLMRIDGTPADQIEAIDRLNRALPDIGHVALLRADAAVKAGSVASLPKSDTRQLLAAIKHSLDPAGILV